jgi:hypothetical protein
MSFAGEPLHDQTVQQHRTDTNDVTQSGAVANNDAGTAVGYADKYDDTGLSLGRRAVRWDDSGSDLPGDCNQDGTVDDADYTVWRDRLGSDTALANDDTPGVGPDDYDRWKRNYGQIAGAGSIAFDNPAVPEPSTLMLLILAVAGWRFRRAGPHSKSQDLTNA